MHRGGVHVELVRATDKAQKLVDVLYTDKFVRAETTANREPPTNLNLNSKSVFQSSPSLESTPTDTDLKKEFTNSGH